MIDVAHQINAVHRQVGSRVLDAGQARTVTISQTYDTDVDDLWDACTNPERLPRWFLPVSGELRLGGRYQLEGNAAGTIESCDPPKAFSATWEYGGEVSWIEVRLFPEPDGGARFELQHIAHVDDERWAEFGPGAVGLGYDMALTALALHLPAGAVVTDDQRNKDWWASAEGKRFLAEAGERWYEADVAAGTPPEAARGAVDRTVGFYSA